MENALDSSDGRVQALADRLDCLTEGDLCTLAQIKKETAEAWRKRGQGPSYVRFGNTFLYPRSAVSEHLEAQKRERRPAGKALL